MQSYSKLKTGISVGALIITAVHIWVPSINVDAITVALLAAAIFPWLQPIFKSVKLPGGIEFVLQEFRHEVQDATGAAHSAELKAELAISSISAIPPGALALQLEGNANERLLALSRKYVDIRANQGSGSTRTQAMTAVVRAMIELASSLPELDIIPLLGAKDSGQRLAAYAYLYTAPDSRHLEALVSSVTKLEDESFGQYWGLQAVARNLGTSCSTNTAKAVFQELVAFADHVPPGSDRDYEVRKILRSYRRQATGFLSQD
jgi:hypothetical protein